MPHQEPGLSADDFFVGFLAGLKLSHGQALCGSRSDMNRAFYRALKDVWFPADLKIDFDPLYGVSPWFDKALTRAQRDLLISFPNPSYRTVEIRLDAEEAEALLDELGHRSRFINLAKTFLANLR